MTDSIFDLTAHFLFAGKPTLNLENILTLINDRTAKHGAAQLSLSPLSTNSYAVICGANVHATITVSRGRCPHTSAEALAQKNDLTNAQREVLTTHDAHITVEVADSDAPVTAKTREMYAAMGIRPRACPAATKLRLFHALCDVLAEAAAPELIHLHPADQILSASDLAALRQEALPVSLLVVTERGDTRIGPGGAVGDDIIARNGDYLVGKTLVLRGVPNEMATQEMSDLLMRIMHQYRDGRLALADGDRLAAAEGVTLHVYHETLPEAGKTQIVASFWPAPVKVQPKRATRAKSKARGFHARIERIASKVPSRSVRTDLPAPDLSGLTTLRGPQGDAAQATMGGLAAKLVMPALGLLLIYAISSSLSGWPGGVASAGLTPANQATTTFD